MTSLGHPWLGIRPMAKGPLASVVSDGECPTVTRTNADWWLVTPADGYFLNYKSFFTFLIILKLNNIWFCYVIVWSDTDTNQLHSIIFFKLFYIGPKFEINKINKECGHSFDYPQKKRHSFDCKSLDGCIHWSGTNDKNYIDDNLFTGHLFVSHIKGKKNE